MNQKTKEFVLQLNEKTIRYAKSQKLPLEFVRKLNKDNLEWLKKGVKLYAKKKKRV